MPKLWIHFEWNIHDSSHETLNWENHNVPNFSMIDLNKKKITFHLFPNNVHRRNSLSEIHYVTVYTSYTTLKNVN
jgi:hypothetical protein